MKFIILGCGSSMGVPRPDGFFGNCDPNNKRNYRTRCSALINTKDENILIDTSPDLRQQLLRHKIKKINKVLFSHMHGDQTHEIFKWAKENHGKSAVPKWNFYKILINKEGKIEDTFSSMTKPMSKKLIKTIENIL